MNRLNQLLSKKYDPKERIEYLRAVLDKCIGEKNELLEEFKMLSEKLEAAIYKLHQSGVDVRIYNPPHESMYWQTQI